MPAFKFKNRTFFQERKPAKTFYKKPSEPPPTKCIYNVDNDIDLYTLSSAAKSRRKGQVNVDLGELARPRDLAKPKLKVKKSKSEKGLRLDGCDVISPFAILFEENLPSEPEDAVCNVKAAQHKDSVSGVNSGETVQPEADVLCQETPSIDELPSTNGLLKGSSRPGLRDNRSKLSLSPAQPQSGTPLAPSSTIDNSPDHKKARTSVTPSLFNDMFDSMFTQKEEEKVSKSRSRGCPKSKRRDSFMEHFVKSENLVISDARTEESVLQEESCDEVESGVRPKRRVKLPLKLQESPNKHNVILQTLRDTSTTIHSHIKKSSQGLKKFIGKIIPRDVGLSNSPFEFPDASGDLIVPSSIPDAPKAVEESLLMVVQVTQALINEQCEASLKRLQLIIYKWPLNAEEISAIKRLLEPDKRVSKRSLKASFSDADDEDSGLDTVTETTVSKPSRKKRRKKISRSRKNPKPAKPEPGEFTELNPEDLWIQKLHFLKYLCQRYNLADNGSRELLISRLRQYIEYRNPENLLKPKTLSRYSKRLVRLNNRSAQPRIAHSWVKLTIRSKMLAQTSK